MQNQFFCVFQAAKRKIQFFLGCRYSAGTYLILIGLDLRIFLR